MWQLPLRLFVVTIYCWLVTSSVADEAKVKKRVDQLPVWLNDITKSAALRGRYVYRDVGTAEVVIAFPSDSNDSSSPLKILRYRPRNQVRAQLKLELDRDASGTLSYSYVLSNESGAKEPIAVWFMVGMEDDAELRGSSSGWGFIRLHRARPKQAALSSLLPGDELYWSSRGIEREFIYPGDKARAFQVTSSYLPGLTTAYAQGNSSSDVGGDMPREVMSQLEPLLAIDQDNQVLLTIGPKFAPSASKASIAEVWERQLKELGGTSDSEEKSVYDKLLKIVQACLPSGENSCVSSDSKKFLIGQQAGLAKEIAEAILLTF